MSLVVIGGSAGGIEALSLLVGGLPADLPAAVAAVIHTSSRAPSMLASILGRRSRLPVAYAEPDQPLRSGQILLAPPDRHLVVAGSRLGLGDGPKENGHRPSIDVLFRSAAVTHGPAVTAVVLSGMLDDGAAGLYAVAALGGRAVVQDPDDAAYAAMPTSALRRVPDAVVTSADRLGEVVARAVTTPPDRPLCEPSEELQREVAFAGSPADAGVGAGPPGRPSPFSCPECHGVLWATDDGGGRRYRCRVGHAWSPESLADEHDTAVEQALYAALRVLEERADLAAHMQVQAQADGRLRSAAQFGGRAEDARRQAGTIRELLGHTSQRPGAGVKP